MKPSSLIVLIANNFYNIQNNFLSNKTKQYHTFISIFGCFFCGGGGKAISALNNSIFKICNTKCMKIKYRFSDKTAFNKLHI